METFSSSTFLLIAIAAIIVAYIHSLKSRVLRDSLQNSVTSLKLVKEQLQQIKAQQRVFFYIIYYLVFWQSKKNNDNTINRLFNQVYTWRAKELFEKTNLSTIPLCLMQNYNHIERKAMVFRKDSFIERYVVDEQHKINFLEPIKISSFQAQEELLELRTPTKNIREDTLTEKQLNASRFQVIATREALLNQFVRQVRNSLDLDTILESAVVEIRDLLQIDRCVFAWCRSDIINPHWEIIQEAKNHNIASLVNSCLPIIDIFNLTTKICNHEIVSFVDTKKLSNPIEQEFFRSLNCNAVLFMPIPIHSNEIGIIICVHNDKPRVWSEVEVELLSAFTEQLVIAIEQAKLYRQSCLVATKAQEQATQLEQKLQELKEAQAQIIQSEKMLSLGQLVAGVAHEINNPINFISGNITYASEYSHHLLNLIQLYAKHYPEPAEEIKVESAKIDLNFIKEDLPKIIGSMETGSARIRQTVLSLRNFSRLDEAEMKWVNIHEGIDNTLLILTHRINTNNPTHPSIKLIKDYGQLPLVQCYAGLLNQVFLNILTNAIDAISDYSKKRFPDHQANYSGTILISTQVFNSKQVIILIGDNGSGMTKEVYQRIFDPFFTTKPVGASTGLGLSITYKIIVEQHHGELQCISAPGKGTAFLIQIPIHQNARN
jgi:signal transduction histidine kinase